MSTIKQETAAVINTLIKVVNDRQSHMESDNENDGLGLNEASENQVLLNNEKEKLIHNEVCVLFAGEINTGKSSLINNIIGEDYCTVNSGVCTNVNTILKYGQKEEITVYFNATEENEESSICLKSRDEIRKFISENSNKNNKKNVRCVEIKSPNDYLKKGFLFIDTPGLGSLNPLHAATTFSVAPSSDIIVFVSTANSELTTDEMEYMERLLNVSKCTTVLHVLTNSDIGEPSTIIERNNSYFSNLCTEHSIRYYSCAISNTLFELHRNGKIEDMSVTGFTDLFGILSKIYGIFDQLLSQRVLDVCDSVIAPMINNIDIQLSAMSDPKIAENRQAKLLEAEERLNEISEKEETWKIKMGTKISEYRTTVEGKVKDSFTQISKCIEDKLKLDEYYKHPDKLGAIISSKVVESTTSVCDKLQEDLETIYDSIMKESGLALVKDVLDPVVGPNSPTAVSTPKVDKISVYRGSIGGRVFLYPMAGAVIGGVVGGIIGTFVTPGAGTLAGAQLGAEIAASIGTILGPVIGFIKGNKDYKESKRREIMKSVNSIIGTQQKEIYDNLRRVTIKADENLRISFGDSLKEAKKTCRDQIKTINQIIAGDTSRRNFLVQEKNILVTLKNKITGIKSTMFA